MTRYVLRLFGIPVLSLEAIAFELVEDESASEIGAGSSHNFTLADRFVDERYLPFEEDNFGFRSVK